MAKHTNKTVKQLEKDTNRDHFMSADMAKDYGLVDDVIEDRLAVVQKIAEEA